MALPLTQQARQILRDAQERAAAEDTAEVLPRHVLHAAVTGLNIGLWMVFARHGFMPHRLGPAMRRYLPEMPPKRPAEGAPEKRFSESADRVLEVAEELARDQGDDYLGPRHLMAAVLTERDPDVQQILWELEAAAPDYPPAATLFPVQARFRATFRFTFRALRGALLAARLNEEHDDAATAGSDDPVMPREARFEAVLARLSALEPDPPADPAAPAAPLEAPQASRPRPPCFTTEARQAIIAAHVYAAEERLGLVEARHLLQALAHQGRVLARAGMTTQAVDAALRAFVASGPAADTGGHVGWLSDGARAAVLAAEQLAADRQHDAIDQRHLAAGLIGSRDAAVVYVLELLHIAPLKAWAQVLGDAPPAA